MTQDYNNHTQNNNESSSSNVNNDIPKNLEQIDFDENKVAIIRRHPFGLFILYVQFLFGLVLGVGLIYFLLSSTIDREENSTFYAWAMVGLFFLVVIVFIILLVATALYRVSRLIVTDKTITQVLQNGLFSRKVSQLSIADIEDVTADKNGIFQTIFNYGILNIETAGEQVNFNFSYCPNPNFYARQILEASEHYQNGDNA